MDAYWETSRLTYRDEYVEFGYLLRTLFEALTFPNALFALLFYRDVMLLHEFLITSATTGRFLRVHLIKLAPDIKRTNQISDNANTSN